MKKLIIFFIALFFFLPPVASAEEKVDLYLFYGDGCPHCADEKEDLEELEKLYPELEVHMYEVWYNKENQKLFEEVTEALGKTNSGVPFTVIGSESFTGYSNAARYKLENMIKDNLISCSLDVVKSVISGNNEVDCQEEVTLEEGKTINLPIFGEINTKDLSLPILTIIIGAVDGFNPCAMWILLFLISMLIGMKDKKRMWILGLTFIITSAAVYFVFMAAWLNLIALISTIILVRTFIGVFGIGAGLFNLKRYKEEKDKEAGCEVIDKKKRSKIFERIKRFTQEKSFLIAIIGIMLLAVSVNLIELICSLGLPAIYTEVLVLSDVSNAGHYLYLLLYTFFFMLDDIIIFAIAVVTFKVTGISTRYTKYSHLIGGVLMLIIGILLIVRPDLLMFS